MYFIALNILIIVHKGDSLFIIASVHI